MNRCFGACLKRLDVLSLNYTEISSMLALRAIEGRPNMECAGHFMSHAPYVGICECAACKKVFRLSGSSLSKIDPSVTQVMSSIASEVIGVSGVNSIGEDKSMMIKTYRGTLLNHPGWYKLP